MIFPYNTSSKIFIIAEAGVNHNGNFQLARQMVNQAALAGADAIKFQTFNTASLVTEKAKKAPYQEFTTKNTETQFEMLKKLELTKEEHQRLFDLCHKKKIMFLSTPFDIESVDFLCHLGVEIFKIPSGDLTNLPYIRKIANKNKKIILSTGMSYIQEIEETIKIILSCGMQKDNLSLLHCNTAYPTPMSDVNLRAIHTLKHHFPGISVGYSDHSEGIEIAIAAAALDARIIEKHFTLDKGMTGPDHSSSIDCNELKTMVKSIRNIEKALGDGIKKPSKSEIGNIEHARKSIVASKEIKPGEVFTESNITTKRPGTGISPMNWDKVIGQRADIIYKQDDLIT